VPVVTSLVGTFHPADGASRMPPHRSRTALQHACDRVRRSSDMERCSAMILGAMFTGHRRGLSVLLASTCISVFVACGGQNTTAPSTNVSTSPPPTTGTLVPPLVNCEGSFILGRTSLTLRWNPVPNATAYVVDVGSASGLSDVRSMEVASVSVTLDFPPQNRLLFVRVRSKNASSMSSASVERVPGIIGFMDAVEALMLAKGRLRSPGEPGGGNADDHLIGFSPGTTLRVTIFNSVPLGAKLILRTTVGRVPDLTLGALQTIYEEDPQSSPPPNSEPFTQ